MNKELDELENYLFNEWKQNHVNFGCDYKLEAELEKQLNNLKSVKQALQRLESIDNAKPSEALEDLDKMANQVFQVDDEFELYYNKVKQHIIKAQEQEKVLEIIKEKGVDICLLKQVITVIGYNEIMAQTHDKENYKPLLQQEFDLLKRWLG